MLYVTKIVEQLILPPGIFIVIGLILAFFTYRFSRRMSILMGVGTALMYFVCTPMLGNALVRSIENTYPQPKHVTGDAIVVLGGGFTVGTPDVTGQGNLVGDSSSRLVTAAMLYRLLHVPILLSGGPETVVDGVHLSEASIGKRELIGIGIPAKMILTETTSRNTQENALFSKPILATHHLLHPILVTSAYHLRRAVYDFHRVGVNVTPYPTDYLINRPAQLYEFIWLPSTQGLTNMELGLKEVIGLWATKMGIHG